MNIRATGARKLTFGFDEVEMIAFRALTPYPGRIWIRSHETQTRNAPSCTRGRP